MQVQLVRLAEYEYRIEKSLCVQISHTCPAIPARDSPGRKDQYIPNIWGSVTFWGHDFQVCEREAHRRHKVFPRAHRCRSTPFTLPPVFFFHSLAYSWRNSYHSLNISIMKCSPFRRNQSRISSCRGCACVSGLDSRRQDSAF